MAIGFHIPSAVFSLAFLFYITDWWRRILAAITIGVASLVFMDSSYIQDKLYFYFYSDSVAEFLAMQSEDLIVNRIIWIVILLSMLYKFTGVKLPEDLQFIRILFASFVLIYSIGVFIPVLSRFTQYLSFYEVVAAALITNSRKKVPGSILVFVLLALYCYKFYSRLNSWPGETDVYFINPVMILF
jgi:hypothetical protein